MKKLLLFICLCFCLPVIASQKEPIKDCKCKKIKLYGYVKIVESNENLRVKIVELFPDLEVKIVDRSPDKCGKWQFVESNEDFRIKFVESNEDISIRYVDREPH